MKTNAVMLAGVHTHTHTHTRISTRSNLIAKISTNLISVINDTNKKSYM